MAVSTPEPTGEQETSYLSSENARLKNIISQCPERPSSFEKYAYYNWVEAFTYIHDS